MCAPSWVAAPGSTIRCGTVRNWKADMQTPDSEDRSQAYSAFPPCACFTWNQKRGLLPLQRAAFPFIRQADGQQAQKTHGDSSQWLEDSFISTMPQTIRTAAHTRMVLTCSPRKTMPTMKAPTMKAPTAPMPVQM